MRGVDDSLLIAVGESNTCSILGGASSPVQTRPSGPAIPGLIGRIRRGRARGEALDLVHGARVVGEHRVQERHLRQAQRIRRTDPSPPAQAVHDHELVRRDDVRDAPGPQVVEPGLRILEEVARAEHLLDGQLQHVRSDVRTHPLQDRGATDGGLEGREGPAIGQDVPPARVVLADPRDELQARLAAAFTMNQLCRDGYFPAAGEDGDGGGFNGIGARWIARFMKDRGEQATFERWLQKNAEAAWQARRSSDNLSWCRWPQPTPDGRRYSWGCSSAVAIMQVVRPTEIMKPETSQ